jgi:regulator of protease activity HflC (stomatin/prohibitin superfamily)
MLVVTFVVYATFIWFVVSGIIEIVHNQPPWPWIKAAITLLAGILLSVGFFVLQPNQAGALVLFGHYQGTVKENGFCWRNPFTSVKKISLRARNLNGEKLKVNDKVGNPIEIAAVVVWKVQNTAEALFDVDDYEDYVSVQSEAAVRHLAGRYPYDSHEGDEVSLRGGTDEVNVELTKELQERLGRAGVVVQEARISHLAYASEIAGAMLRRQQAQAVIAARQKIVEGAVGMVEMALTQLSEKHIIELDDERKAAMVGNLLVVLCGEEQAQPVVNAGTLYT